ncbi:SDR family NAD(P)-dependent oxidoreductase [bacterium]
MGGFDRFQGKVAVVTGSGQGIGKGVARRFASEGAKLAIVDMNADGAGEIAELIKSEGGEAIPVQCDVSNFEQVQAMAEKVIEAFGTVDILVNNAGLIRDGQVKNMSEEMWDLVLNVNTKGSFLCVKALSPTMIENRYGKIINISSRAAMGNFGQANYSAAKGANISLTRTLALEFGRFNINCNCIAPGYIDTPLMRNLDQKIIENIMKKTPLQKGGTPDDIAATAAFLCSDEAHYITGQTIYVCGGRSMNALNL